MNQKAVIASIGLMIFSLTVGIGSAHKSYFKDGDLDGYISAFANLLLVYAAFRGLKTWRDQFNHNKKWDVYTDAIKLINNYTTSLKNTMTDGYVKNDPASEIVRNEGSRPFEYVTRVALVRINTSVDISKEIRSKLGILEITFGKQVKDNVNELILKHDALYEYVIKYRRANYNIMAHEKNPNPALWERCIDDQEKAYEELFNNLGFDYGIDKLSSEIDSQMLEKMR